MTNTRDTKNATDAGSRAAPSVDLEPGTRLGHYRIDALLGRGGSGMVYRGFDTKLNRPVAIKFLSDAVADDDANAALSKKRRQLRRSSTRTSSRCTTSASTAAASTS